MTLTKIKFTKKNAVSLSWVAVKNATSYNIYRDDDLINSTTELEYSDYKLKFDEDYSYTIVSVDHHQEEGPKSSSNGETMVFEANCSSDDAMQLAAGTLDSSEFMQKIDLQTS